MEGRPDARQKSVFNRGPNAVAQGRAVVQKCKPDGRRYEILLILAPMKFYGKPLHEIFHKLELLKLGMDTFLYRLGITEEADQQQAAERFHSDYQNRSREVRKYLQDQIAVLDRWDTETNKNWKEYRKNLARIRQQAESEKTDCPDCGSENTRYDYECASGIVRTCKSCKHIFQTTPPPRDD